jgi:tripartite-type tricarboxylate transporter receptor subunit TctC
MTIHRRQFLQLATSAFALQVFPQAVFAQNYPTRPVRQIVGFPAGGAADTASRIICDWLTRRLGQQVFVDNRPGAGSALSVLAAAKEPPDG